MSEVVEGIIAELDTFEPTDDAIDNEERLQILVDRWQEMPDHDDAIPAMLRVFERNPEATNLGEPGPLVHAIEEAPGYEQALAASLDQAPSYYAVWMINRILSSELPPDVRSAYIGILRQTADNESAPWSVRATAKEFLGFQEG
ncbi:MAG TPA: hypothetical protein VG326_19970 [Tepidisphaeraceae bacterium]|jgi:hypothetical protein|nr:hypothetical protein [Tepidisphaeraceae bacterium]